MVGITASQSARNTLAAGVPVSYNAAQFLGHLPGRRGARGPVETGPAPLLVIDEASAMPGPDLADLIAYAQARDGKVILAGDTGQLQAVENGGGMSLLAAALGYVRLAEPVRFRHAWEQQASLRLHDGDTTVLAEYDQHGRIAGGEPEQMMDAAAAAYVALAADGTDVLLMAADHALRRELCRRIRDDLIALGVVAAGPAVRIADGAQASAGDLITCTRNDHHGRGGRTRPGAGQRGPAPDRGRHRGRAGRAPRPGRRPGHRAAAVDRPHAHRDDGFLLAALAGDPRYIAPSRVSLGCAHHGLAERAAQVPVAFPPAVPAFPRTAHARSASPRRRRAPRCRSPPSVPSSRSAPSLTSPIP